MEVRIDQLELPENVRYKDPNYWDEMFAQEDSYEWLASYEEVRDILKETLNKFYSLGAEILRLHWTCTMMGLKTSLT